MATRYVRITEAEMKAVMDEVGFVRRHLAGVHEEVYERDRTTKGEFVVRVYTTIAEGLLNDNESRDVGTDAIRVHLVWRGPLTGGAHPKGVIVWSSTRVHRTQGWREKMVLRMREAWTAMNSIKKCGTCGVAPMVLRRTKDRNRTFYGCVSYPNCKGTANVTEVRA